MSARTLRVLEGATAARAGWADWVAFRDLLRFLVVRDLKIRYSQSILGFGWALLPPVVTTLVFTFVFGRLAKVSSDGIPYPLFALSGMVCWSYFAATLGQSTGSVTVGASMLSKVFFPRMFLPIAPILGNLVDLGISAALLVGLAAFWGVLPQWSWLLLPLPVLLLMLTAGGLGIALSAVSVQFRDVKYGVPLVLQMGLFLTPVAYPSSLVPAAFRPWFHLNPVAGAIEGFRAAFFGQPFPWAEWSLGLAVAVAMCVGGLALFRALEASFADVA